MTKYIIGNPFLKKYKIYRKDKKNYITHSLNITLFIKIFYDMRLGITSDECAEYVYLPGVLRLMKKLSFEN